ncbi:hypothetical protein CI109_105535 [Kwoniella shandongensis]|uniref:Uncharacterized protein n=1 Tax=Kwoniella shandongensis TaxID=1734106 RepID=A0AAJ8LQN7_9TREE
MVAQVTPFIANIIVDQIIERKLQNLPDGAEKVAMMMERKEKMADWKAIQLRVNPKPIYKRTREYEDDLALRLQDLPDGLRRDRQGHVRRASRNLPALGQPINHTPDLEVGAELLSTSSMRERLDELRSLRDGLYRRLETERLGLQQPNAGPVDRPYTTTIPTLHTPSAEAVRAPLIVPPNPGPNQSWPRPSFGSSVHRRSTGDGDHGTRNDPLVVLSDSSDGE